MADQILTAILPLHKISFISLSLTARSRRVRLVTVVRLQLDFIRAGGQGEIGIEGKVAITALDADAAQRNGIWEIKPSHFHSGAFFELAGFSRIGFCLSGGLIADSFDFFKIIPNTARHNGGQKNNQEEYDDFFQFTSDLNLIQDLTATLKYYITTALLVINILNARSDGFIFFE